MIGKWFDRARELAVPVARGMALHSIAERVAFHRIRALAVKRVRELGAVRTVLLSLSFAAVVYSMFHIGAYMWDSHASKQEYGNVRNLYYSGESAKDNPQPENLPVVHAPDTPPSQSTLPPDTATIAAVDPAHVQRFGELLKLNRHTVGWIDIADTNISYPVVQADDNEYYLDHSYNQKKNKAGAIFMDYRNSSVALGRNTILYGHHMKDGTMFKHLVKFLNEDFFGKHRIISFDTPLERTQWEIFAVYETDTKFNYIETEFKDDTTYSLFLKDIQRKSLFPTDTVLDVNDHILTLSTCSYVTDDARLVVHAKRVK